MTTTQNILLLLFSTSVVLILLFALKKSKKESQLKNIFVTILILLLFWYIWLILQLLCINNSNIQPIFFENFIYISACFIPVLILILAISFIKTKIKFSKKHLLLAIIPITSLIVLWTNGSHHLFYEKYSTNISETVFGAYFNVHSLYSYGCIIIGMILLLRYSIKNSGLFSKQSICFILGTSFSLLLSICSAIGIFNLSIYATPMSFAIALSFYAIAIFKFEFLGVAPIALQKIVDRISDSYIVLDEHHIITDFNKTFLTTFKINIKTDLRGKVFENLLKEYKVSIDSDKLQNSLLKSKNGNETISFELFIKSIKKYFNVEINSILSNGQYLGTLILFKDITQHKRDIQTIKDTQDSLMESERLSSLGQLIGGIAHNLKTPIMSIAGAAEGLTDLVKEYDESIDDPTVNSQDHHEIAQDMSKWIVKIKEYSEYMSDIITAVKGQAVVMANEDDITFTISELVKRINILMKHELKNAIITLNTDIKVNENLSVNGDVNNLVQVINNMISNAIQAYNGKTNETIEFVISKQGNNVIFTIEDHASGLPEKVKSKLFKEMITTKGKNGTGLGLYMSYSTIKAHFNGNITFESEDGKGTKFNIIIPLK